MANYREAVIEELCRTYADAPEIGFVLGAGVTIMSGVPSWWGLSLKVFEKVQKNNFLSSAPFSAVNLLNEELRQWQSDQASGMDIDPEQILQFVSDHIDPEVNIQQLIKDVIYENIVERSHKMVAARTYRDNKSLDAFITFCAAVKDSPIASESEGRWVTNRKVGAILTTNYDNLVEGSCNSKYGRRLLKPVTRKGGREILPGRRVIPVYHMHGYISYVTHRKDSGRVEASDLVLTEKNYYQTFYDLLGFSNTVAGSFFRRFNTVFIGCSLKDRNLRRILYYLQQDRIASSEAKKYFAILPSKNREKDDFDDALLKSFGVTPIRVEKDPVNKDPVYEKDWIGAEVEDILKQVYLSVEGVDEGHWDEAMIGSWKRKS